MDELISIVIPVYNKKEFLMKSLSSCKNQSYRNIEIILVDDGSTDGSSEICRAFTEEDGRFKYYSQENHGASYTRNRGIGLSNGEWIVFLDADDELSLDFCSNCLAIARRENADVVFTASKDNYPNGKTKEVRISETPIMKWEKEDLEDLIVLFLLGGYKGLSYNYTLDGPCCKILKKSTLDGVKFPEHIDICEDTCFMTQVIMNSSRIVYVNQLLYLRNIDLNSLSYSRDFKKTQRIVEYIIWMVDYLNSVIDFKLLKCFVTRVYCLMMKEYLQFSEYTFKERKKLIDREFDKIGIKYLDFRLMSVRSICIYLLYLTNANTLFQFVMNIKNNKKKQIKP